MNKSAVVLLLLPFAAACATTRAQVPIDRPALEVPPVPPRVIEPMPPAEPLRPEPVGDLPPERTVSKPRPQPQRDTAKPENKPENAPPVDPPAQAPPATAPAVVAPLRTDTTDSGAAERQVREIITRSEGLLGKTHYQGLPAPLQALYNNAKAFLQQSEDALKASNYDLARKLADKAETIAKELQSRYP